MLTDLAAVRYPVYAEADITIESGDTPHHATVDAIIKALKELAPRRSRCMSRTIPVGLGARTYDVAIGTDLIERAGALIKPFLKRGRAAIVADETVMRLHGPASWSPR